MSRLFHAVVVVGAGLSVSSCGGKTQDTGSVGAGGGVTGKGGNQDETSDPSTSSSTGASTIPVEGQGGAIVLGVAGAPGQAGAGEGMPTPFDPDTGVDLTGSGTFSQWNCPPI